MAIGKVDCTSEKPLCNEFGVRGYPTLKYSVDGELFDYSGGRDEGSLLAFAKKLSGPPVKLVQTYDDALRFAAQETEEGVAFLGYDPRSTEESPSDVYQVFHQVARKERASAYFVWLNTGSDERNYQFIHKIEPTVQPKSFESDETDITTITADSLSAWVKEHNLPLVSELGPSNFQKVSRNGRPVVVGVVDFDNEDQKVAIKDHITEYAKTLKGKDADQYYFGLMDGKRWGKFLTQFNVVDSDNPQTIVLDVPSATFWQNTTYKNTFEFMKAVQSGEIQAEAAKKNSRPGIWGKIESLFIDTFPYSLLVLLVFVFGIVFLLVPSGDDLRPPYDRAPENEGEVLGDEDETADEPESEPKKEK